MLSPRFPLSTQVWADGPAPAPDPASAVLAAMARQRLGLLRLAQGDHRAGLHALAGAQHDLQHLAQAEAASDVARDLADACLRLGLWPEAQARLRMLVNHLQGRSDAPALPWLWLQLAEAQVAAGQTAEALSTLGWAQVQFTQRRLAGGWAQAELARLRLQLADPLAPDDAARLAAQARALQTRLAMPCPAPDGAPARHLSPDGTALLQARWLQSRAHRLGGALPAALALLPRLCGPQTLAEAPAVHALAWAEAGLAYQAQGDVAAAISALDHAIHRLDDLHWALPCGTATPDCGTATTDALLQACAARLALAAEDAPPAQALHWLHRQRVRQLRPLLAGTDILRLATPEQRLQLQAWRVRHAWLQRAQRRARQDDQPGHPGCSAAALQQVEQALLNRSRRLRRARWPGESALLDGEDALDIPALRQHFRLGRALVAYGEAQGRVLALVIAQGAVHRLLLPTQVADLAAALQRLRQQWPLPDLAHRAWGAVPQARLLARCTRRMQAIHQQIWAPLETALAGADDLVVVPGPALQTLPFAALHDGSQWLDQRCRLRQAATVAGAVVHGAGPAKSTGAGMRTATPHTRAELAAALRAGGPLHLACPVRLRRDNPAASGWRLGDGSLARPADLAQLAAATPLVWLDADTACAPGHGPGDARLALPLALQRAGVPEVIDSLWPVPAAATAALQAAFAAASPVAAGCTATALQQARATVRAVHPHPAIWAAPCLLGGQPAGQVRAAAAG